MKPSFLNPGLTVRILSFVVCAVVLCSQVAEAAQVSSNQEAPRDEFVPDTGATSTTLEQDGESPSLLGPAIRNALPPRSPFPMPQFSNKPGKSRLYVGMGVVVLVGAALLAYGFTDSCKTPYASVQACFGGQCGTVVEHRSNCAAYKAGGAAVTGLGVFGFYAVHKWGR